MSRVKAWATLVVGSVWAFAAGAQPSTWTELGPAPSQLGQVEGIPDRPVSGAVHALAPHPTNADVLYVGAVNGGVWRSSNATAATPSWTRLTDAQLSNSIGDLDFDPTDVTNNTLVAGIGRRSSFSSRGGPRIGLLRTTDGGSNWTVLSNNLLGRNVSGVIARGNVILASVDIADSFTCANVGVFRSTDTGATFTKVAPASGLPGGGIDAMAGDPVNPAVLYASVALAGACSGNAALNGIYKSTDTGATWTKVSTAAMDGLFDAGSSSGDNVRIATLPGNVVAVAIARTNLLGVFHSANGGTDWTSMGLPSTLEGATNVGLHAGGQGSLHLSLAVDPTNNNLVYVGGDRQPVGAGNTFPNSLGASDFSGRLFRGDITLPSGTQWTSLTHVGAANNSSPHADSREMRFDATGRLLEADDGGVYARLSPALVTGAWISLNGDLQVTEQHSANFDPVANAGLSGNQDTGTTRQVTPGSRVWSSLHTGDGGDVATDVLFLAAQNQSIGYSSFQNLSSFRRRVQDADNVLVSTTFPARTVTSGPAFAAQFTTPVATNQVAGGRLILGGANSVYESLDRGDTIAEVPTGIANVGIRTTASGADNIAYGALGNAEVLYVGGCRASNTTGICLASPDPNTATGVFVRTTAGGALTLARTVRSGASMQGIALDPDDPAHAFAVESSTSTLGPAIFRTTDTGAGWNDVIGDLPASAGVVRSIAYLPGASADAVVIGTDNGVFITSAQRGFTIWTPLGLEFPRVPVYDLSYDATRDLLLAGTLGRGAYTLEGVMATPTAVDDSALTQRETAIPIDVLANDSDLGGALAPSTVTIVTPPPSGAATAVAPSGTITYTPPAGYVGSESFSYRVRDDIGGLSNLATVSVRVNAPPVATDESVVAQRDTALPITVLANDADADGTLAPASVAVVSAPASGSTSVAPSGVITYTPSAGFTGTVTFGYSVQDNDGALSNTATVTVRVNAPPVATDESAVAQRNTALPITVLANDTDADGTLAPASVAVVSAPASGSTGVAPSGVITYTPAAAFTGTVTFGYTVQDNDGGTSNTATVTVRVNAPPSASNESVVTQRDTALPITVLTNDTDADGTLAPASVAVVSAPASGSTSVAPSGVITYTPSGGFTGTVTFGYTVQDNDAGTSNTATVTVRVNAPPSASDDNVVTQRDTALPITVLTNDTDADGTLAPASVAVVSAPASGSTSVAADGVITYTPAAGFTGAVTFGYTVLDNDGAISNTATVTVQVNAAPVAGDDAITMATGGTATTLVGGASSLLADDTDADNDALVLTTTPVAAPAHGSLTLAADGTFSYVHDGSTAVVDEFTYEVCDTRGGCDTARVAIQVSNLPFRDGFE